MKQEKHIDLDAMLRNLPQDADKALNGLQATPFLKARIDRAVAENKQGKVLKELDAVAFDGNKETLEAFIPAKKANLIDINCQALQAGYDY